LAWFDHQVLVLEVFLLQNLVKRWFWKDACTLTLFTEFGIFIKVVFNAHVTILLRVGSLQRLLQALDLPHLIVILLFEQIKSALNSAYFRVTFTVVGELVKVNFWYS